MAPEVGVTDREDLIMEYAIVLHKDGDSDYGVTIPDLPGCFSAGADIREAIDSAKEAAALHIEGLLEDGEDVPRPSDPWDLLHREEFANGLWYLIDLDIDNLDGPALRLNISLPERLIQRIDAAARREHESRSGFLAAAARKRLTDLEQAP